MGHAAGQQHPGGAPRALAELAEQRLGGELHQRPAPHDVAHPVGRALHGLGALGVGQDHAVAADLQVGQDLRAA